MSLAEKAEALRVQLGIDVPSGTPIVTIVERCALEVGMEKQITSLNLVEKCDVLMQHTGVTLGSSPVSVPIAEPVVQMVQAVALGAPLEPPPVIQPIEVQSVIQPIAPMPPSVQPAAPQPRNASTRTEYPRSGRKADGTWDARALAGCWGCICIPGGVALEMKQADGPDALVHKGIAIVNPIALLGVAYEDRWRRIHGNVFQKEGADDKLDYSCSPCVLCFGPGITCKVAPACYPTDWQKIPAEELAGSWCCACVPCGWSCVNKQAQGPDTMRHSGVLFWWFVIPIPYNDIFVREGNKNIFHKRDDPNMKAIYFSRSCTCGSLLGGECRLS